MIDKHNTVIVSILVAVVLVGVVGIYMSSQSAPPTVIYSMQGAQVQSPSLGSSLTRAFSIRGSSITGRESQQSGTAVIDIEATFDIRKLKGDVLCVGKLLQTGLQPGEGLDIYPCEPTLNAPSGVWEYFICDDPTNWPGPPDSGSEVQTSAFVCDHITPVPQSNNVNRGAFVFQNIGQIVQLEKTLVDVTLGGDQRNDIWFDNYFINSIAGGCCPGDGQTLDCNQCPEADTIGCEKALSGNPWGYPESIVECTRLETTSCGWCQCVSIHLNEHQAHQVANGEDITFELQATLLDPTVTPPETPAGCDAFCGDGVISPPEGCDDGIDAAFDQGCDWSFASGADLICNPAGGCDCVAAICGDGVITTEIGEVCDTLGNVGCSIPTPNCAPDCLTCDP